MSVEEAVSFPWEGNAFPYHNPRSSGAGRSFEISEQRWMRFFVGERRGPLFAAFHHKFVERRIDRQGVVAVEAGETELAHLPTGGTNHSLDVEIAEAIDAEVFADFLHRHLVGDQLLRIGKID